MYSSTKEMGMAEKSLQGRAVDRAKKTKKDFVLLGSTKSDEKACARRTFLGGAKPVPCPTSSKK